MDDIDRRTAALLTLLTPLAAGSAATSTSNAAARAFRSPPTRTRPDGTARQVKGETVAMLLYPGMTALDLVGPHTMLAGLDGAEILLVARTLAPVTGEAGMTIVPNATFETCPREVTMIFVPGGTDGAIAAARDPATLAFVRDRGTRAGYVTSVCTGSLVLGAAGLLCGYRATSHWICHDALAGFGAIPTEGRVVRDRNRITGAGVTSGLDFGLAMVAQLRDRTYAETCQLINEYDPHPPFQAGSPGTAPATAVEQARELLAPFRAQALALATDYRKRRQGDPC